jgi:hypothetical protein
MPEARHEALVRMKISANMGASPRGYCASSYKNKSNSEARRDWFEHGEDLLKVWDSGRAAG